MTQQEIIEIVKNKGKLGCTDIEHYIDIDGQIYDGNKWIRQVVFFNDERGLAVYWLDEYNNGDFMEYSEVCEIARNKIETILKRDYLKHYTPHFKLYAIPHDGVTDLFRDREAKNFYATDPYCQYRKSKLRVIDGIYHFVEIIKKDIMCKVYLYSRVKNKLKIWLIKIFFVSLQTYMTLNSY